MNANGDGQGPIPEIEQLLRHAAADVRAVGARLAGKLELGYLRPVLRELESDPEEHVRRHAAWALSRLTPDGGRGSKIFMVHGGCRDLKAYRAAEIAYDATVVFCDRFIGTRSRTHDQMVQAARSGKQNLVEGSAAAGTSSKTELFLVGVARNSLEELLDDYMDYLRQHGLSQWSKDDPRMLELRKMAYQEDRTYMAYRTYFEEGTAEVAANAGLCLVYQAGYLLDCLKKKLEQTFLEDGGMRERMFKARMQRRDEQSREFGESGERG